MTEVFTDSGKMRYALSGYDKTVVKKLVMVCPCRFNLGKKQSVCYEKTAENLIINGKNR